MFKDFLTILNHKNHLSDLKKELKDNYNNEQLSSLYKYIKRITPFYYQNKTLLPYYSSILEELISIEQILSNKTIINTEIPFKVKTKTDNLLDQIIRKARIFLIEEYYECRCSNSFIKNILKEKLNINFEDYCQKSAEYIQKQCINNNIKSSLICISPAYDSNAEIYNGTGYHYINIINYNNSYYLLDITFQQFFSLGSNNIDRLGVLNLPGCSVGNYILMSEKGKIITEQLINNGYVQINEELLKVYLDAFTLSYRNGLYYENNPHNNFTTDYSFEDYTHFLSSEDNLLKHEKREYLGFQLKPLKNSSFTFDKHQ